MHEIKNDTLNMDSHVVYQAIPIDLNEYFSPSGSSSLLPTFVGNRNDRDDDDGRKKLYLLGGLVVTLILALAIVLPIVHHHHRKPEHLHLVTTDVMNVVGNDGHEEPWVLLETKGKVSSATDQEEHSINSFYRTLLDDDTVVDDDEAMFWRYEYRTEDDDSFEPEYSSDEDEDNHAKLVHEQPGSYEFNDQDWDLEDEDDDDAEMFREYYLIVPPDAEDDLDEFDVFETIAEIVDIEFAKDAFPELDEGEANDTALKADDSENHTYDMEILSEDSQDDDRLDGLTHSNGIAEKLLVYDEVEPEEISYY